MAKYRIFDYHGSYFGILNKNLFNFRFGNLVKLTWLLGWSFTVVSGPTKHIRFSKIVTLVEYFEMKPVFSKQFDYAGIYEVDRICICIIFVYCVKLLISDSRQVLQNFPNTLLVFHFRDKFEIVLEFSKLVKEEFLAHRRRQNIEHLLHIDFLFEVIIVIIDKA